MTVPIPVMTVLTSGKWAAGKQNMIKDVMISPKPAVPMKQVCNVVWIKTAMYLKYWIDSEIVCFYIFQKQNKCPLDLSSIIILARLEYVVNGLCCQGPCKIYWPQDGSKTIILPLVTIL